MKHRHSNRILSRSSKLRQQLLQNLSSSLLQHGSIVTTAAKAKELRRFLEPLVTKARPAALTLHQRRLLQSQLMHKSDLVRLTNFAGRHQQRPGGYLRLTRVPSTRADAATLTKVELL